MEQKTHRVSNSLHQFDSKPSFFQTEPFFPSKTPDFSKSKRVSKPPHSEPKHYSISGVPRKWISIENSPFRVSRLKPFVLSDKASALRQNFYSASFPHRSDPRKENPEEEALEIERKLRENTEVHVCEDERPKDFIGEKALVKYQDLYKNLDKILAENRSYGIKNSLITDMLSSLEEKRLLPLRMGVVKLQGKKTEINLNHYKMGDHYGTVFSETLRARNDIVKLNLSDNKLRSTSASQLFHNLNKNTKKINLSKNHIGKDGCQSLAFFLKDNKNMLTEINLEDNKLNDQSVLELFKNLKSNLTIRKLNLSKNQLTDHSARVLREVLKANDYLAELYLHWNQIQGTGGLAIFEGLSLNDSLKVLDLSWNALGSSHPDLAKKIGVYLQNEKKFLIHLDLSFNNFSLDESKTIQKHLTENHTLFGFHFRGNYGFIDQKGFLQIPEDFEKESMLFFAPKHRILGVKHIKKYIGDYSIKYKDQCWICAGWQEAIFSFNIEQVSDFKLEACFIHLDIDDWRPIAMEKVSNKSYMLRRMCPRGRVRFFFTVNEIQITSEALPTLFMEDPLIRYSKLEGNIEVVNEVLVYEVNYIDIVSELDVINEDTFSPLVAAIPRKKELVVLTKKRASFIWNIEDSAFNEKREDDEELVGRCFEIDYENSKIKKFAKIPAEETELKAFLRSHYRKIKEIYHYLAALDPHGNILCISQNTLSDFVKQSSLLDPNYLKFSDIDISYLSAYVPLLKLNNETETVTGRFLIRCQFIEIIVRLAYDRFLRHGLEKTILDATAKVLLEHITPYFKQYDYSSWRERRLWTLECDKTLKHYWQFLHFLYKKYASKFVVNIFGMNSSKMMYLAEFRKIFQDAGLVDEFFTERDANLAFSMSVKYHENEITLDRTLQLSFAEFLEAFARTAEKISTYPVGITDRSEWPLAKRMGLVLPLKIEGLVALLMNRLWDKSMKEMIGIPKKSLFEEEIERILEMSPNRLRGPIRNSFVIREDLKGNTLREKLKRSLNLSVMLNKVADIVNIKKIN